VLKEKLEYARDVRDGEIEDPRFLPVLCEFPPEMIEAEEHKNPANFFMTNPNMGGRCAKIFWSGNFARS